MNIGTKYWYDQYSLSLQNRHDRNYHVYSLGHTKADISGPNSTSKECVKSFQANSWAKSPRVTLHFVEHLDQGEFRIDINIVGP